jgi:hypothetical protein
MLSDMRTSHEVSNKRKVQDHKNIVLIVDKLTAMSE